LPQSIWVDFKNFAEYLVAQPLVLPQTQSTWVDFKNFADNVPAFIFPNVLLFFLSQIFNRLRECFAAFVKFSLL